VTAADASQRLGQVVAPLGVGVVETGQVIGLLEAMEQAGACGQGWIINVVAEAIVMAIRSGRSGVEVLAWATSTLRAAASPPPETPARGASDPGSGVVGLVTGSRVALATRPYDWQPTPETETETETKQAQAPR
jgi:hypothetical protein